MKFEDAIEELLDKCAGFKQVVESFAAEMAKRAAVPKRKIDGIFFTEWHIKKAAGDSPVVVDAAGDPITQPYIEAGVPEIVVNSADTMRDVIDLVNEQDKHTFTDTLWLRNAVRKLRGDVINSGFGCDLND